MTLSLAVVCEARADRDTACDLADRVICEDVDWIEPAVLDDYRRWRGFHPNDEFLLWKKVHALAREQRIPFHGHFAGQPGCAYAFQARRALLLLMKSDVQPDTVFLILDEDTEPERSDGLRQARDEARDKCDVQIVVGIARAKRECWVLAGFVPKDEQEQKRLDKLGFDPTCISEKLTAKPEDAKRSAKRVLRALTDGNWDREAECWRDTPLEILKKRGQNNGLAAYLEEVDSLIVTLFSGRGAHN